MNTIEAILAVRNKVEMVAKDSYNQGQGYNYASHNAVIHAVRDAMNEVGLVVYPLGVEHLEVKERPASSKGGYVTTAVVSFKWCTADDAAGIVTSVVASGFDSLDKGAYKLDTGAAKYNAIMTLQLATDLDPENDSGDKPEPAPTTPQPRPTTKREEYIPETQAPSGEEDDVPFKDGEFQVSGKLTAVSEKTGNNARGKWTKYGLKVGDQWYNTFSKTIGELAKTCKGNEVDMIAKQTERGWDVVSLNGVMHG